MVEASGVDQGERPRRWVTSWPFFKGTLVALLGLGTGLFLHSQTATECEGLWADAPCRMQAYLMAASFAIGFIVFVVGCIEARALFQRTGSNAPIEPWESAASLLLVVGVVVVALAFTARGSSGAGEGFSFGLLIPALATALALPMALVVDGIRQTAYERMWRDDATQLGDVVALRFRLRRSLNLIGGYLAISILAVGAYHNLDPATIAEPAPATASTSAATQDDDGGLGVLVFGAFFTGLAAAYYLPAHAAIDRLSRHVRDDFARLPERGPADVDSDDIDGETFDFDALDKALDRRAAIGRLLGLEQQPIERLKEAVLVSAPLLSGLFTVLIGD